MKKLNDNSINNTGGILKKKWEVVLFFQRAVCE